MSASNKGFTLFEILVAIVLFAFTVTIVFTAFREITASNEAITGHSVYYEMAQGCLQRITQDLQSIYVSPPPMYQKPEFNDPPDPYRVVGETGYAGGSSFSRLRFTSLAHLPLNGSDDKGVAEIVYYVLGTDAGHYTLRRSDRLFPYETFEENYADPVLCDNLIGFDVTYYGAENADDSTWDSDSPDQDYATPRSVQINLKIGDADNPIEFKTRVKLPIFREKRE